MNKTVLLVLMAIVASMTGGCSFLGNAKKDFDESTSKPIPKVKSAPNSVAVTPPEEEFSDLEEEDAEPTQTIAGLIPTTDPDARIRNVVRGRQDPFSVVSLVPNIEIEKVEEEPKSPQPVSNRNNISNSQPNPISQRPNPNPNPNPNPDTSKLPTPSPIERFKAELAQAVVISGLYESSGSTKLIVQAPEESSSRYVEVGQYLSNGQILVKSIDRNHFPTPLVILEQSGVEVAKAIGETLEDSQNRISAVPTQDSNKTPLISKISLNSADSQ